MKKKFQLVDIMEAENSSIQQNVSRFGTSLFNELLTQFLSFEINLSD